MTISALLRRWVGALSASSWLTLTRPLPSASVVGREGTRARLLLAAVSITALTIGLADPAQVDGAAFTVTLLAMAATAAASLVPACWPFLNRFGGLLMAGGIVALIAFSGGADSPYDALHGMLLIYATMFYGTGRLAVTAALLVVLFMAPALAAAGGPGGQQQLLHTLVEVGVWAAVAAVVHGLMRKLRERHRELRASEQRYRSLFDDNPDAVFSLDRSGSFTSMNAAGGWLLGVDPEALIGRHFGACVVPAELPAVTERFVAALGGQSQNYELTMLDADGCEIAGAATNVPIMAGDAVVGVHGIVKDISHRKALEDRLAHAALHDSLTGLANRTLLADRALQALQVSERTGEPIALLALDLDGFKPVNDTHGHLAGDALLKEVATRMAACSRPGDTLARLGGDEFAVLLPAADRSAAVTVAQRVIDVVSAPVRIGRADVVVGASVGIAVSTSIRGGVEALLRDADTAMYAAKRTGRGRLVVFGTDLDESDRAGLAVRPADARAWARYLSDLQAEVERQRDGGVLPFRARVPESVLRVQHTLLAAVDELPQDAEEASLPLPDAAGLEELYFHQTMVHSWADSLVREGILQVRRPAEVDRFWSRLGTALGEVRPQLPPAVPPGGSALG